MSKCWWKCILDILQSRYVNNLSSQVAQPDLNVFFFFTLVVECFLNDANILQTLPRVHPSSVWRAQSAVFVLLKYNTLAATLESPLVYLYCPQHADAIKHKNASPCYIFLGAFICACLYLRERGRTGSAVTFITGRTYGLFLFISEQRVRYTGCWSSRKMMIVMAAGMPLSHWGFLLSRTRGRLGPLLHL